jgi:hypothetical protein
MNAAKMWALVLLLSCLCIFSDRGSCFAKEPKRDEAFYQKVLDHQAWEFSNYETGIFYSMSQTGFAYQIELIRAPGKFNELTIRFVKDGKTICSWLGHEHSVFAERHDILVYALFSEASQGCTLIAVNLKNGEELWRTDLKAIPLKAHSGYSNAMNLHAEEGIVTAWGHESFGNYVEIVDINTGKLLAHREYEKEKKPKTEQPGG